MEFGTIEREIFVEASQDVVFDVVSSPEHLRQWWPDEARYEPVPGSRGQISFGDCADGGTVAGFQVVDARPHSLFSFRWLQPVGEEGTPGNSMLVRFELEPREGGTLLRMTETGFREMGWDAATLEQTYRDHVSGWDVFLPRIAPYVTSLAARR